MMPERFDLKYTTTDGGDGRPAMIHRAMRGSLERFMAILIEHTAGAFPLWLAPEQIRVLSITDRTANYASQVRLRLLGEGLRATADVRSEKIGAKIRQARLERIPIMLVVGDRESADETVAVRYRESGDQGAISLDAFLEQTRARLERSDTDEEPVDAPDETRS